MPLHTLSAFIQRRISAFDYIRRVHAYEVHYGNLIRLTSDVFNTAYRDRPNIAKRYRMNAAG